MLLMPGNDTAHPAAISDEVLRLAPRIEYLKQWKNEGAAYSALATRDFLRRNTPSPERVIAGSRSARSISMAGT